MVIGHGGMGIKDKRPMNSLASLQEAIQLRSNGTEMDLQLSADNELWLYHPGTLEESTKGKGRIRDLRSEDLDKLSYTSLFGKKADVIRLSEFLSSGADFRDKILVFDCKLEAKEEPDFMNRFADRLLDMIRKYKLKDQCFIESYNIDFLRTLQAEEPGLKLFIHADRLQDCIVASNYVQLYGITMDRLNMSAADVKKAHELNLRVALFNLDTKSENLEGIRLSPDFLQTDKMEYLLEVLKK